MKKYTLPVRSVDRDVYDLIESGAKKIETRAAGPRYENIQNGDLIVFKCGKDKFERTVKNVEKFENVEKMLVSHKVQDIDPRVETEEGLKKMYHSFPGYDERLKKYGIIAFELEK